MSEHPPRHLPQEAAPSHEQLGERERFERHISEQLNNKETIAVLKEFPEEKRGIALGCAVEYFILFPEATDVADYLKELQAFTLLPDYSYDQETQRYRLNKVKILVRRAEHEIFGGEYSGPRDFKSGNREDLEKIYAWFKKRFQDEGYFFHGFNGMFENSIREHGLLAERPNVSYDDIERVNSIFKELDEDGYGMYSNICGWSNSSKGKVYFTDHPAWIHRYATMSPEWFGFFAAEGSHHGRLEIADEKKTDKEKRITSVRFKDYALARKNIEYLCDTPHYKTGKTISAEDREFVLNFFDTYWNIFVDHNAGPRLALIQRQGVSAGEGHHEWEHSYDTFEAYATDPMHSEFSTIDQAVRELIRPHYQNDSTSEDIAPEHLRIIALPEYKTIHRTRKRLQDT